MRIKFSIIFLMLPFLLFAQQTAVTELLEQAVMKIEADAAVQMTFSYVLLDEDGNEQFADAGSLKLDGERYSLLISPMKLWCDGKAQWSYITANNEIYITEAGSEEAQIYNPAYLMGLYKKGYDCKMERDGGNNVITLVSASDEPSFEKVVVALDEKTLRPVAMSVYMNGQGCTRITINGYKPGCMFDDRVYRCPLEDFPGAEVVDMR